MASTHRVRCLGQYGSGYFICQDIRTNNVYLFSETDYARVDFRPRPGIEFDLTVEEIKIRDNVDPGSLHIDGPNGSKDQDIQHLGLIMREAEIIGVSNVVNT